MSDIPLVMSLTSIPKGATCQEASPMSGNRYLACGSPAMAIIHNGDSRPYYMCRSCAIHNLRNRGAKIIFTRDKDLPQYQVTQRLGIANPFEAPPQDEPKTGE